MDNWDEIEDDLESSVSENYEVNTTSPRDDNMRKVLTSGQEAVKLARSKKQSMAASALVKQRNLLATRNTETRSFPKSEQGSSHISDLNLQPKLAPTSPRSPRSPRGIPGIDHRPTPLLVIPDRSHSPAPVRTNTPLPNIRASHSYTNLSVIQPSPPSTSKSPRHSPRIRHKRRSSLDELCDQLDSSLETSKSDDDYHLMTPAVPMRSRSTENLSRGNRLLSLERPEDRRPPVRLDPANLPSSGHSLYNKTVLKPI